MKKIPTLTFDHFLEKFPEVELPVVLSEEAQTVFSKENSPLPKPLIEQFIIPLEEDIDEYTEFVPCFSIPNTSNFHAVVYWKAGLLSYEYILISFDKNGKLIDKQAIAGTQAKGDSLLRTIATIEEDWMIMSVIGVASANENHTYDPSTSLAANYELLPDGKIISLN